MDLRLHLVTQPRVSGPAVALLSAQPPPKVSQTDLAQSRFMANHLQLCPVLVPAPCLTPAQGEPDRPCLERVYGEPFSAGPSPVPAPCPTPAQGYPDRPCLERVYGDLTPHLVRPELLPHHPDCSNSRSLFQEGGMGYQGKVVIRAKINKDALIIDLHCIVKGDSANAAPLVWLFKMT